MDRQVYNIFCDESRQDLLASANSIADTNRYCCIGGVMVLASSREKVKSDIKNLQDKHKVHSELKWGTVSPSRLDFYLDLIDYFFENPDLSFRTIVIDASKIDNEAYNDSNQELGYYKFYYQLLHHWMDLKNIYRIYTDQKTNGDKMRLRELRNILNRSNRCKPRVDSIQSINSKESIILQLENILMGAVGYKYNFGMLGNSNAKNMIVKRIEQYIHREIDATTKGETKFNIFEIYLRGGC